MCPHPLYQTWDAASSLAVCMCPLRVGEEFFSPNKTERDTGQLISAPSSFSGWCWDKRGPFISVNRLGPSRPSFRPPAESLRPGCLLIACVLAVTYRESPVVGAVAEFLPYENRDFPRPHCCKVSASKAELAKPLQPAVCTVARYGPCFISLLACSHGLNLGSEATNSSGCWHS